MCFSKAPSSYKELNRGLSKLLALRIEWFRSLYKCSSIWAGGKGQKTIHALVVQMDSEWHSELTFWQWNILYAPPPKCWSGIMYTWALPDHSCRHRRGPCNKLQREECPSTLVSCNSAHNSVGGGGLGWNVGGPGVGGCWKFEGVAPAVSDSSRCSPFQKKLTCPYCHLTSAS